jgi:hypothetical protein
VVKEGLRLAQQKCLLLTLIADEQHRDVGADQPRLARSALRIGPDETPTRFSTAMRAEPSIWYTTGEIKVSADGALFRAE